MIIGNLSEETQARLEAALEIWLPKVAIWFFWSLVYGTGLYFGLEASLARYTGIMHTWPQSVSVVILIRVLRILFLEGKSSGNISNRTPGA